jgi:hydroxymethylpyrimidine pyrophosphatase-like HAD family hydrolase
MSTSVKTVFCDIDGTLLKHHGNIFQNATAPPEVLPGTYESLQQWEGLNYTIVLTTGRKESQRKETVDILPSTSPTTIFSWVYPMEIVYL